MVFKGLQKRLEAKEIGVKFETMQTVALSCSAKVLRKVMETEGDMLLLRFQ